MKEEDESFHDLDENPENTNYQLLDCRHSHCERTQGYVVLGTSTPTIYAFVGNNPGIPTTNNEFKNLFISGITENNRNAAREKCDIQNYGKIYTYNTNERGICIDEKMGVDFKTDNNQYLIFKGKAVKGTPFDSIYDIPIKCDTRYIIRDQFINDDGNKIIKLEKKIFIHYFQC